MERRYLVATLAVIATFAVFSNGLRTVEPALLSYSQNAGANLKAKCNADTSALSHFMSKVRTYLSPDYPDEAQLMADMNLPIAMAQAKAAEEVARQNIAAAQCARDTALRQAELGRREADRAQRQAVENARPDGAQQCHPDYVGSKHGGRYRSPGSGPNRRNCEAHRCPKRSDGRRTNAGFPADL